MTIIAVNLKGNRKEAIAIAFLTMLATLMLAVFASNLSKSSKAFDDSFASSGAYNQLVVIEKNFTVIFTLTFSKTNMGSPTSQRQTWSSVMPEVRKALVTYKQRWLSVKGSQNEGSTSSFDDFADAENIRPIRGRFPEHDNEIMVTVERCREEGFDIGDSIILEGNGMEQKYIITGVVSSMMNNGMELCLTSEGYARTQINARPNVMSVYLADGVTGTESQDLRPRTAGI